MYRVVYFSTEAAPFSDEKLNDLLDQSRRNNLAREITGLLLYKDGNFMQFLEGMEQTVLTLLDKIKSDARHKNFTLLRREKAPDRAFKDWSMKFHKLGPETAADVPAYRKFEKVAFTSKHFLSEPSQSLGLLFAFKERGAGEKSGADNR